MAGDSFVVAAIIAAHNEADVIAPVIGWLVDQGVLVHLLDHESTDGTAAAAAPWLGRGLLAIEPFPGDRFPDAQGRLAWADILTRKQELASSIEADWFIHHDADEFRESPWPHRTLCEAIRDVDRAGYNAIDFELLDFRPTDNAFRPGGDPRRVLRHYEPGRVWDRAQIKCWKKQPTAVDLVSSGGHDVAFPGRRVAPLRFILRHYPIRNDAQGRQKVFVDRRPRILPSEAARGWHVQYEPWTAGQSFVRDPADLVEYDGDAVRRALALDDRDRETLRDARDRAVSDAARLADDLGFLGREVERLNEELRARGADVVRLAAEADAAVVRLGAVIAERRAGLEAAEARLHDQSEETSRLRAHAEGLASAVHEADARAASLVRDVAAERRQIGAIRASRSWRWTRPLRAVGRFFTRA